MKASKVIEELERLIKEHGDLEFFIMTNYDYWSGDYGIEFKNKEDCTCLDAEVIDHFEAV